jgi:hypothetical protein
MSMNRVRTKGSDRGRNKTPPSHLVQYEPENRDKEKIVEILAIIHKA